MEIIKREEKRGVFDVRARGNKIALRGLYYWSPWIRDLQACSKLREMFCQIAGEELVPHPSFSNSPQVIIIQSISLMQRFLLKFIIQTVWSPKIKAIRTFMNVAF